MSRRWDWPYALLVLLLSVPAIGPTLNPGYWWGAHDARHSVYFLFEFDRAVQDGVLWPRWSPDFAFGYGYPFFNIYGPLSSFVGEALHLMGLSFVDAVKVVFALSVLASGLAMYGFVRHVAGPRAGVVAGVAYVYLPYHLADVYVRAALAESVALVWLPLVFWGFLAVSTAPTPGRVAWAALAYTGLLLSHNGLTVQATFVLGAFVACVLAWRSFEEKGWPARARTALRLGVAAGSTLALGMAVGGIFLLPWVLEYKYVRTDQWLAGYYSYREHFVQWWQLFDPRWGFGVSVPGPDDTFPFQLGVVPLLLGVAALWVPLDLWGRRMRLAFAALFVLFTLLMLEQAAPAWSVLGPLLSPVQFPWRLLVFAGFALAFLSGLALARAPDSAVLAASLLVVTASYPYVQAEIRPPAEGPVSYAGLMRFQRSAGEMTGSSIWVREIPTWSPLAEVWVRGGEVTSRVDYGALPKGVQVASRWANSQGELVEYRAEHPFRLAFNIAYYPGWRAYLLDPETEEVVRPLEIVPHGTLGHIRVEVPAGHHLVLVRFEDTRPRRVGKVLSLVGLLIVGALLLLEARNRRKGVPRR